MKSIFPMEQMGTQYTISGVVIWSQVGSWTIKLFGYLDDRLNNLFLLDPITDLHKSYSIETMHKW